MGIIDDYLRGSSDEPSTPSASSASGSVINQYMSADEAPTPRSKLVPAGAPVNGQVEYITPEEQAKRAKGDRSNPREGLSDVAVKAGKAVSSAAGTGVLEAGKGLGEALSGKPASGLGRAGMGLLSVVSAPSEGISSAVTDLTGSKEIGDRAGLVGGAVIPIPKVGSAASNIKSGAANVVNSIRTGRLPTTVMSSNRALKDITEAIGPENAGRVAAEMRADSRLTPADLSPSVKQSTQQLYVQEGDKAKQHISEAVGQRRAGAQQAAQDALDTNLGATVNPFDKVKELETNIKSIGAKEIQPAVANAKPVNITPVIEHIDKILKPGMNHIFENPENLLPYDNLKKTMASFRDSLTNDVAQATNAADLHKLQSNMRRTGETLIRSTDGESKAIGHALFQVRNKIVDAIDAASPQVNGAGTYKPALAKYRDENNIKDAFDHGHDAILKNGMNLKDHPEYFKNWLSSATDAEKEAARQGARVAIDTAINGYRTPATNPNSRAIQMSQVDFNRQRIEALFGKEEADKLFKKLDNERIIADTDNKLIENSQTAMRSAANSRVALPTKTDVASNALGIGVAEGVNMLTSGAPGLGSALYTGAKAAAYAKDKIGTALAKERNAQFAKYALPTEAPTRQELIQHLEAVAAQNSTPRLSLMNKGRVAIGLPVQSP